jgi:ketosteroid isomerase-like protein
MATDANPIEIVESIYEAFATGDLDAVMAHCAPDVTIDQDPELPWGGHFVGRDGMADFALKLVGTIGSTVTVETLFRAGDRVVQHGRTAGTVHHNGAAFDVAECHLWTFRDGQVVAAEFFIDGDAMRTALDA